MYNKVYHKKDNPVLNNNNTVWKDIKNFKGLYQASSKGEIRSIDRHIANSDKSTRFIKGNIKPLHSRSETCIYLQVNLWKNNKGKSLAVHRIIAETFILNPENKPEVNHIDGNKLNNNVYNLEWNTVSENRKHAFDIGLQDKEKLTERMIGTRRSKYSNYRNVSWDSNRQKWMGGIKHKGKVIKNKRFDTEEEAANHVNWIIDTYNLNRPKNIII